MRSESGNGTDEESGNVSSANNKHSDEADDNNYDGRPQEGLKGTSTHERQRTNETEIADSNKVKDVSGRKRDRQLKLPQCCQSNTQFSFYIGGGNGTALVEGPLLALGWRRTLNKEDEKYRLKWTESKCGINYVIFREGEQLVNHIPNCKLLTNKLGLLCSLQEYERVTLLTKGRMPRLKMVDFVPETYKLDERADREKFLKEYKDGETWICKPVGMNQGKGILLLRSRNEINQILSERETKFLTTSRIPMMRIVQRYITHPLLLEGRKFDIRSYMLISSTVPFLVLYHNGYVRLSCQKYNQEDRNLTIHLTNQYIQKKDPSYLDSKEDTVWTMDKLNQYINEHVAAEKGLETDWVYKTLTKQMQKIARHCFICVKHKLHCKLGYFDLYGLDFMVDSEMKVWLIEINSNPALQTNCQALKEAIPCVVENALYLAIECFEKSRKGQPLMPLNSLGGYTVIFCGTGPKTVAPRQSRSVSPVKDTADWNRRSATTLPSRSYSPPRLLPRTSLSQTSSSQSGPTGYGSLASSRVYGKEVTFTSSLPTVNIGVNIGMRPVTISGNTSTSKKKQSQQHFQHHQVVRSADTSTLDESGKRFHVRSSELGIQTPRDKSHRGN